MSVWLMPFLGAKQIFCHLLLLLLDAAGCCEEKIDEFHMEIAGECRNRKQNKANETAKYDEKRENRWQFTEIFDFVSLRPLASARVGIVLVRAYICISIKTPRQRPNAESRTKWKKRGNENIRSNTFRVCVCVCAPARE